MTDLNIALITGRLVRDTELRSTSTGSRFAWFQLAVNGRRDKNGNHQTDYIPCQVWGKPAEMLQVYGKKGVRIMISHGSLKTYIKEDPTTNIKQNYTYLLINSYEFLDGLKQAKQTSSFEQMGSIVDGLL